VAVASATTAVPAVGGNVNAGKTPGPSTTGTGCVGSVQAPLICGAGGHVKAGAPPAASAAAAVGKLESSKNTQ